MRSLCARHGHDTAGGCLRHSHDTAGHRRDTAERGATTRRPARAAWVRVCTWCTQPNFDSMHCFQSQLGIKAKVNDYLGSLVGVELGM